MMTQPELGIQIAKLRQQQGWTQEMLAEKLAINTRSVQRIEAGESEPRAHTITKIQEVFGDSFESTTQSENDLWLILMHLSSIVPVVLLPLVIWIWKRAEDSRIDYQAIDILNFQITMWLAMMIAGSMVFYIVGLLILPVLGIFICVITIKNTLRVAQGQPYHYPFSLNIIKRQG